MSEPLLHVHLSAGYGKSTILDGLEFDLCRGESLGLVGTSAAGKSTLALALLGLLPWRGGWAQGEVLLQGRNLIGMKEREARKIRGREIALVPQSAMNALNPAVSLEVHFREAWRAHSNDWPAYNQRLRELLEQVQLPPQEAFRRRKPGEVSVGQAQRVTLAMALLHRPSVLVADEPTSALDAVTQHEILNLLRDVTRNSGMALLLISHDLISVLQLCQQIGVLHEGRIAGQQSVHTLDADRAHPALRTLLQTLPVPLEVLLRHSSFQSHPEEGLTEVNPLTLSWH